MNSFSIYKAIYYLGVVFIFLGGYRLLSELAYGDVIFSIGVMLYSAIQLKLLFYQNIKDWILFEWMKSAVNLLFLSSIFLLLILKWNFWYFPFVLGMLIDFLANIFKRINRS